ncbi:endolytic transglycosylase MltG [Clostridium thermobutyricum]|uniref:endolytic transglycosylase MltG n=1 Tax=Clostridium thermobutyricum TaxID=29372 RepID=UPI003F522563
MKKKKLIIGIIIAIVVIIIIAVSAFFLIIPSVKPFNTDKPNVSFVINTKENFNDVLNDLSEKNIIKDKNLIEMYTSVTGKPSLMPGQYTINSKVTVKQFLNILKDQKTITVVIPEGYTVNQIAGIFDKIGMFSKQDFINAVNNYKLPEFIKPVQGRKYQLEGYLFPTTYAFKKGESVNTVIETMINTFVAELDASIKETGVKITPAQINETVTKASIIEKEAKTPEQMKNVSSVIDNRLKANMPLQMDDTVLYSMDKLGENVTKVYDKDLKTQSPYNTYLNKGLPIGPICNPGKQAIEAALKPNNTKYLYYILTSNHSFFTDNFKDFTAEKNKVIN